MNSEFEDYNKTLVSIIVITYQSSKFIKEALDSIKEQTYPHLELIISDDGSHDETIEICEQWLAKHKERFTRVKFVKVQKNTGIPSNLNRGIKASNGRWIKPLGGDDALQQSCIEKNIQYVNENKDAKVVLSCMDQYIDKFDEGSFYRRIPNKFDNQFFGSKISPRNQYRKLLIRDRVGMTPTAFYSREVIKRIGFYDERFKLIEDYPMWLRLTKSGYKLHFMNAVTVNHRKHANAVHNTTKDILFKGSFIRNEEMRKVYVYPNINLSLRLYFWYRYYMTLIVKMIAFNKSNKFTKIMKVILVNKMNLFSFSRR